MTASFQDFKARAAEWWPDAFVAEGDDVFALASDGFATLSVGADGALYATERRTFEELGDADALKACVADFARTADDWRGRSALYV